METAARRVNYREDQRLRATDLTAEQEYLIERERCHNRTLHSPGIVLGLDVTAGLTEALARQPGVCIDEEGRLLALEQMQEIAAPAADQCVDSWLVFCAAPRRVRRPGLVACGSDAYDRWCEFVRIVDVVVNAVDDPAAPEPDAVYLGRTQCDSAREIPYAALAAARGAGPRGDMVMWVGPETGRDRNGFSIRAAGEATPRLAIDRLGVNRCHGDVTLSDYHACAQLELPDGQMLVVQVRETGIPGLQTHFRLQPTRDGQAKAVRISLFAGSHKLGGELLLRQGDNLPAEINKYVEENKRFLPNRITLKSAKALKTIRSLRKRRPATDAKKTPSPAELAFFEAEQDISVHPCGGMLFLDKWPAQQDTDLPPSRGCLPVLPSDKSVQEANGLSFEAMTETPKTPPLPGAYSVQTGKATEPAQEVRLDLGEERDNDQTTRLCFVHRTAAGQPSFEWLRVSGSGAMYIAGFIPDPDAEEPANGNPPRFVSLKVSGTIRRGPIQADPADPHFTKLLVLAWMEGLRRSIEVSTVVRLAFKNPLPPMIETGKPWSYTLVITNTGSREITVGGAVETQSVAGQSQSFLKNITGTIAAGAHSDFVIDHGANDTPAGSLNIEIEVFSKVGTPPWRQLASGGPIEVVERPQIGFDGFPDSVPPGASWEQSFIFRNPASRSLTLNSVTIAEGNGVPQPLISAPLLIPTGGSRTFVRPTHPGITVDLRFTVQTNFTLDGGLVSALDDQWTVRVELDLRTQFVLPASVSVGDDLTFDIFVNNQRSQDVSLTVLRYRLISGDFAPTSWQDILPAQVPALAAGDILPLLGIHGVVVPAATASAPTDRIKVELDMEYLRGARALHPKPAMSDEIEII